ncbi:MAG: DnaJ domain-containing protein [Clostridiales bacterium]|nr:DnaJ domain-containing protein [Clostridiales bacterium]
MKDYYKTLEITSSASTEVIKAAYKALVKKYHPDNNGDSVDDKIQEINEAYSVLSDEKKREEYDRALFGNSSEKNDGGDFQEYSAGYQETSRRKSPVQSDPKRRSVQGLIYKGHKLYEIAPVCYYLNFKEELEAFRKRLGRKKDSLKFLPGQDNFDSLSHAYVELLNDLLSIFQRACNNLGFVDEAAALFLEDIDDATINDLLSGTTYNAFGSQMYDLMEYYPDPSPELDQQEIELCKNYIRPLLMNIMYGIRMLELCYISILKDMWPNAILFMYEEKRFNEQFEIKYNKDQEDAVLEFCVMVICSCPYWPGAYNQILTKFGDEEGTLQKYAAGYGIDLTEYKEKLFQKRLSEFSSDNLLKLDAMLHMEKRLHYKKVSFHNETCKRYITTLIKEYQDWTPAGVTSLIKTLDQFDKKYEYDSSKERTTLQSEIIARKGFDLKSEEIETIKENISSIKALESEYGFEFTLYLSEQKKLLSERIHQEEQKRRKAEEEKRTVLYVKAYKLKDKRFIEEKIVLPKLDDIQPFQKVTEQIKNLCLPLSFETPVDEWLNTTKQILAVFKENDYPNVGFVYDLNKQYSEVDYICGYDISSKKVSTKKTTVQKLEDVDNFKKATKKIESICQSLSFEMEASEWSSLVKELLEICEQNKYPETDWIKKLDAKFSELDKEKRTFNHTVYKTREEAQLAREDKEIVDQIDKDTYDSPVERLRRYKQAGFRSEYGLKRTNTLEKQIISGYSMKEKNAINHFFSSIVSVPVKLVEYAAYALQIICIVLGVISILMIGIKSAIAIFIVAYIFYLIKNTAAKYKRTSKPVDYSGITVMNGKIIWKGSCQKCLNWVDPKCSYCPHCGAKIDKYI